MGSQPGRELTPFGLPGDPFCLQSPRLSPYWLILAYFFFLNLIGLSHPSNARLTSLTLDDIFVTTMLYFLDVHGAEYIRAQSHPEDTKSGIQRFILAAEGSHQTQSKHPSCVLGWDNSIILLHSVYTNVQNAWENIPRVLRWKRPHHFLFQS